MHGVHTKFNQRLTVHSVRKPAVVPHLPTKSEKVMETLTYATFKVNRETPQNPESADLIL